MDTQEISLTEHQRYWLDHLRACEVSGKGIAVYADEHGLDAKAMYTAKANGLEPYAYLRYLFTELPKAGTVEAIEALLPGNLNKDQIKIG